MRSLQPAEPGLRTTDEVDVAYRNICNGSTLLSSSRGGRLCDRREELIFNATSTEPPLTQRYGYDLPVSSGGYIAFVVQGGEAPGAT